MRLTHFTLTTKIVQGIDSEPREQEEDAEKTRLCFHNWGLSLNEQGEIEAACACGVWLNAEQITAALNEVPFHALNPKPDEPFAPLKPNLVF